MHHDDIRACVHLLMHPFLQPIVRSQPFRQAFLEKRHEWPVAKDVVMLVHDYDVGVRARLTNTLKNALRVLLIWRVSGLIGKFSGGLVLLVARFDAEFIDAWPIRRGV